MEEMTDTLRHPRDLTPEHLTQILKECGALIRGEVRGIKQRRAPGWSGSYNRHLEVDYSPETIDSAPTRLFLKLEPEDHNLEVAIYKHYLPTIQDMPAPKSYAAEYNPDERGFYLLLEDLSATHHSPEYGPGCAWPQVSDKRTFEQVMDGYARFHAFGWGHC